MKRKTEKADPSEHSKETKVAREKRDHHWNWVPRLFAKPRSTLKMVNSQTNPTWLAPMVILTVMVLLAVIVAAPIKRSNIQTGASLPDDFQWWSQDQQEQYLQAQQNLTSPTFMYLFPIITNLAGYLLFWLISSSLLYLSLTLAGSRTTNQKVSNLIAWAMLPFALRELVKVIAILASKQLVDNPGFSYLVASDATGLLAWLRGILGQVDAYAVLFVVFLFIGAASLSGLKPRKTALATAIALLLMMVLIGVPEVISSALSGLGGSGYGYF